MSHALSRADALTPTTRLLLVTVPVAAAALVGSAATIPNVPTWYAGLAKPPLTPPDAVFGPVWTLLYLLMGAALWRVLGAHASAGRRRAASLFWLQLGLNALWPLLFFGAHATTAALIEIVVLLIALATTIRAFAGLDRTAAALLVPYGLWAAFAAYLNAGIVLLNA